MQDFRKLLVWRRAHELTLAVRRAVRRHFPRRGCGKLIDQLTRAADSIPENIAEGCGAATNREFGRFLDMAIKSENETEYELLLSRDCGLLPAREWRVLSNEVVEVRKMTFGLRRRVIERAINDNVKRKSAHARRTETDDC